MKLHLLRHAKTNQESDSGIDFDRKLLPKGIRQAELMAEFLKSVRDIEIHCSTSARTRQTYEIIAHRLPMPNVHFSDELYLSNQLGYLKYINALNTHKDILLIGHNNGISDFAGYLCEDFVDLKTCGYLHLDLKIDHWNELSKGLGTIVHAYRPEVD